MITNERFGVRSGSSDEEESCTLMSIFGVNPINQCVYVVRSKKQVIYIGLAEKQSVQSRLSKHFDSYFSAGRTSQFSQILYQKNPENFKWWIDTLTIKQVKKITGKNFDCLKCAEQGIYDFYCQKKLSPIGNKTRPKGCVKKYMVKGVVTYIPIHKDNKSNKNEFISTISGVFHLKEKINRRYGTNFEGYDCVATSKYKCDLCSKPLEVGGGAIYHDDNLYCGRKCILGHDRNLT